MGDEQALPHYFILEGREPRQVDLLTWGRWIAKQHRTGEAMTVARDDVGSGVLQVATVFLGMNMRIGEGPPLLFNTLIYGDEGNPYEARSSTWVQAEAMHAAALAVARQRMATVEQALGAMAPILNRFRSE